MGQYKSSPILTIILVLWQVNGEWTAGTSLKVFVLFILARLWLSPYAAPRGYFPRVNTPRFFVGLPRRPVMPYDCGIPRVPIACSNVQTADLRRSTLPEQEGGVRQLSEFCAHFASQS